MHIESKYIHTSLYSHYIQFCFQIPYEKGLNEHFLISFQCKLHDTNICFRNILNHTKKAFFITYFSPNVTNRLE